MKITANGRVYDVSTEIGNLHERVCRGERLSSDENLIFAKWMSAEMAKRDPKGMLEASIVVRQRMAIVFPSYQPFSTSAGPS